MKSTLKPSLGKQMLIFLISLILILSAYLIIASLDRGEEQEPDTETVLTVARIFPEDVIAMNWQYQGESVSLTKQDGQWKVAGDASFPLDQNYPERMLEAGSVIQARESLNAVSAADYGLDAPALTVGLELSGGEEHTLALSPAGEGSGSYYLQYDGGNVVYLVDDRLLNAFGLRLYDMVIADQLPVYSELKSMWVNAGDKQLNLVRTSTGASRTYSSKFLWFIQNKDGTFSAVDNELTEELIASVMDGSQLRCVDYRADSTELAAYGLSDPRISIMISYVNIAPDPQPSQSGSDAATEISSSELGQFILQIGNQSGEENYARIDGSAMVYMIPDAFTQSLINTTADSLKPDDVLLMDWETVTKMDVAMNGAGHTLEFHSDGAAVAYTLNGVAADSAKVEAFLAALDALESVGRATAGTTSGQEIGIMFYRNTEKFSKMAFSLTPYDENSDVLSFNEQNDLLVDKRGIDKVKEAFAALLP